MRLSAPTAGVFRLEAAETGGRFDDRGVSQFLAGLPGSTVEAEPQPLEIREVPGGWTVVSPCGSPSLLIGSDPFRLVLCRQDGSTATSVTRIGRSGTVSWLAGSLWPDERLWGTGERFNGVNQRGKVVRIWAVDPWCRTEANSYVPIPFVVSSGGWAVFVNRYESSQLDLGAAAPDAWRIGLDHAPLDVYLFVGAPRPYDFPPAIVDIYRLYSDMHYALVPYLREQASVSCRTGIPLVRHLVLGRPGDRIAWDCGDEYLLGSDLLVAPVLDDGEERDVHLPEGR